MWSASRLSPLALLCAAALASTPTEDEDGTSCLALRSSPASRLNRSSPASRLDALRAFEATVDEVIEKAFANVTGLGKELARPVFKDPSWIICASESWDDIESNGSGTHEMNKLLNILACDAENADDPTCHALVATYKASVALTDTFPEGPKFANYLVTNWGDYPSWEEGAVEDVVQESMPPSAKVIKGNGLVMYGVCEAVRSVLLESPNQVGTGTCGWISSLGMLSVRAPAKALKMALRLTWTGRATPQLSFPCDYVLGDQYPGLVPYQDVVEHPCETGDPACSNITGDRSLVWRPEQAAGFNLNFSSTCSGNPGDCLMAQGRPVNPFGLAGMWIQSLISGYLQDAEGKDCSNSSLPGIFYPGQSPEEHEFVEGPQGQMDPQTIWMCNAVIDPVGKGCTQLFNPQAACASYDDDTCRDLAIRNPAINPEDPKSMEADRIQQLLNRPSFTEDMLHKACASEVALLGIDAGHLNGGPLAGQCNHQVALLACDHDADNYTIWTWGERRYLTRADIFEPRYSLEEIVQSYCEDNSSCEDLTSQFVANSTSNASAFGGMFCTAILSDNITFATL